MKFKRCCCLREDSIEFRVRDTVTVEQAQALSELLLRRARYYCLGYRLYDIFETSVAKIIPNPPWPVVVIAAWLMTYAIFYLVPHFLTGSAINLPVGGAAVAAIGVLGIFLVRWGYDIYTPTSLHVGATLPKQDSGRAAIFNWIIGSFDLKRQFVLAIILILFLEATLGLIDIFVPSFPISLPSYIVMTVAGLGGSAIYWLRIRYYGILLLSLEIDVFPLDPRLTPAIQEMRQRLSSTLIPVGFILMITLVLWAWIIPYLSSIFMTGLMIIWYTILAIIFSIYYFGSMNLLSKIVSHGKKQVIQELQNQLRKYYSNLDKLSEGDWEKFQRLITVYNYAKDAPENLAGRQENLRYILSLGLQAIPLIFSTDFLKLLLSAGLLQVPLHIP